MLEPRPSGVALRTLNTGFAVGARGAAHAALLLLVLVVDGCVPGPTSGSPRLAMRGERVDEPRAESCPGTPLRVGSDDVGATPFSSNDEVRTFVGSTVWFAANGRVGDWGREFVYKIGDPVVLCSERPFENAGRVASAEVFEANAVLIKRDDGAFFNVPLAALSSQRPRFDGRHQAEAAEEIGARFLEYLQAKRYLAAHPETPRGAFDRTMPAYWALLRRTFYDGLAIASSGFGALVNELDDVGQYHALLPILRCRTDFSSDACREAEAVARTPPKRTGAPRHGGTLLLSIRPLIRGTVVEVDGVPATVVDGRATVVFEADGAHRVVVRAPGRRVFESSSPVIKGETTSLAVVLLP